MNVRSGPHLKLAAFVAATIALVSIGPRFAHAQQLLVEGRARILDNRTIEIWGQQIRLNGIVVPAVDTAAGMKGKQFLEHLTAAVPVRCETHGPRFREVTPGRCFVANLDIAQELVRMGYALAAGQESSKK